MLCQGRPAPQRLLQMDLNAGQSTMEMYYGFEDDAIKQTHAKYRPYRYLCAGCLC